ncbi:asparagine synthetase domain-containing protein CG17486 [Teleopsis dalmanni]|uniref:asparagine synthetase domain-containing protein CG17486 n=1 Tax=Teleopsis dalmanni TaxID=139649 RepID=UPI0018CFD5C7|nr:asparagine synthetase domain-containing protein CG17486 [Teleopsis dalmanni]
MCGIFCLIGSEDLCDSYKKQIINRRGPNAKAELQIDNVTFAGYVLWQQGSKLCPQPLQSEHIVLIMNGDIYSYDEENLSDTEWLIKKISECKTDSEILTLFTKTEGPFSIVFFNKKTKDLYFCRDKYGRNSLIIERSRNAWRILSTSYYKRSTSVRICELPPLGLYKLNIKIPTQWNLFPWSILKTDDVLSQLKTLNNFFEIKILLRNDINLDEKIINGRGNGSFDFYDLCNNFTCSMEYIFVDLLNNKQLKTALKYFSQLLEDSVKERVIKTVKYCRNCVKKQTTCHHSKIAILFSGGIDCSILAVLTDKYVSQHDTIDLINVAFENATSDSNDWNVPDRQSAKSSLNELQKICPARKWNFIEVNVSKNELAFFLHRHIKHLIYPLCTVLDESIGCAFWFASRGEGICNGEFYDSPARVAIVGSGADELFGGYTRHRNAYSRCKKNEEKQIVVRTELERDWKRISSRNLARDDRIIADNGKTVRAPYIEEKLVNYVRSLSPGQRCCFLLEQGIGDKLFLRLYGYQLGLTSSAFFKKKAIQFGSKVANRKQNAKDQSKYLKF